jgi:hypothetical protein
MENVLTAEDKKYLRFFSKYIQSYGEPTVTFRFEDWYGGYEDNHSFNNRIYVEENYYLEIPVQIIPILKKVMKAAGEKEYSINEDYNSIWGEIKIDSQDQTITFEVNYDYYSNDESEITWTLEEEPSLTEIFESMEATDEDWIEVPFDGSGDSGSIEQATDSNGSVVDFPANAEDWCYSELENRYGGWEINEGSHGRFIFNLDEKSVTLEFNWHNQINESNTLLELKFDN